MNKNVPYKAISSFIKKEISDGRLLPLQKVYSESELVKMFNVSRATAAKSLDLLTTENYIYRIQGKGSFVASHTSVSKKKKHSMIVSLILPFNMTDSNRIDEFNVIRGVENYLQTCGYNLLIHYGTDDHSIEVNLINQSRSKNVDGIIVYPPTLQDNITFLNALVLENFPIVFIDHKSNNISLIPCVSSDNTNGGYLSASHLIAKKFEAIYFVSDVSISATTSINDRYFGYCKALIENGYQLSESNLIQGFAMRNGKYCPTSYNDNADFFRNILEEIKTKSGGRRFGIVCVNDLIAYSFIMASIDLGYKLTEDIGIVGFNDADIASHSVYPITTIRQDFYEMGRASAKMVVNLISQTPNIENKPIEVELITRSST